MENSDIPPIQKNRDIEWCLVGTDVEALFPSQADVESARIVREAIRDSEITLENVNYTVALRYLLFSGGTEYILEI